METNIYFRTIIKRKVVVDPKYLNENVDEYIQNYLKNRVEGKCIYEGYIRPESVRLLKRSAGMMLGSRFTGDMTYEVAYSADVCNPSEGNIIECKVSKINKTGILGYTGPLTILAGRELHDDVRDAFNNVKIGDNVKIYVIGKSYSLEDKEIKIIGKLHGVDKKGKKNKNMILNTVENEISKNMSVAEKEEEDDEEDIGDMEMSDDDEDIEGDGEGDADADDSDESEEEEEEESDNEGQQKIGGTTILKGVSFGDDFSDYSGGEDDVDDDMVDDGYDDDGDGYYSDQI